MHINKKILFIALSISFHGAIMPMNQAQVESKEYIETMAHYMSEENSEIRKQNILPFADWITEKRNVFRNDNDWNEFCKNNHTLLKFSIGTLPLFKLPEALGITTENMVDVIMNRAHDLQPNYSAQTLIESIDQDLLVLYYAFSKK